MKYIQKQFKSQVCVCLYGWRHACIMMKVNKIIYYKVLCSLFFLFLLSPNFSIICFFFLFFLHSLFFHSIIFHSYFLLSFFLSSMFFPSALSSFFLISHFFLLSSSNLFFFLSRKEKIEKKMRKERKNERRNAFCRGNKILRRTKERTTRHALVPPREECRQQKHSFPGRQLTAQE